MDYLEFLWQPNIRRFVAYGDPSIEFLHGLFWFISLEFARMCIDSSLTLVGLVDWLNSIKWKKFCFLFTLFL